MERLPRCLCIPLVTVFCSQFMAMALVTDPSEVSALLCVKRSLIDPWQNLKDWNKGDPCSANWTGVLCSDELEADGYIHVQELYLMNLNLSGSLAPELGQLSHLIILNFMWNSLTGSIPKEIGSIASLRLLLLNGNRLSGSLPDELGYLPNLNRFQIDLNQISGPIPKSFSNLNNVKHFHFNNNSLSGQIPLELANLTSLLHLLLDNNKLSGYLPPEFSALHNLRIMQLDNNNFSGAIIPNTYGNLSRLVKLSLRNCSLQGPVPDLSQIPDLQYLDLSWNHLTGSILFSNFLDNITTIDLSENSLNGSIPGIFMHRPALQKLSLANNHLGGPISSDIWQRKLFTSAARLMIDLQNNSFSNILGELDPPENVTLRLQGNPICSIPNANRMQKFCGPEGGIDDHSNDSSSAVICPIQACPEHDYYEYVPGSPIACFCASPLRIGYRLKSPSFSYFSEFKSEFESYLTGSLNLQLYQLYIDTYTWEEGPRLRMYLKLYPQAGVNLSSTFNTSEILRIRGIFTSWHFPGSDFFGPYELLNFTFVGPYAYVNSYIQNQDKSISKGIIVAVVVASVAFAAAVTATLTIVILRWSSRYQALLSSRHSSTRLSLKIDGVKSFTYKEMALATDEFNSSTQVGKGGYGTVYKGVLSDKTSVAVKRAKEGSLQGKAEFLTEIELLSRVHHRNLVSLIGYCDEDGEQLLVYEFMPNGTLRDWLSAKSRGTLNFGRRLRVALGAARGIAYLHTEASPPIIHRDVKSSNILLDSKFNAKVADFGLSRLAPVLDDEGAQPMHVSTIVKGTPGYLDPEYFLTHKLTDKSDVYSLGVVLLEILTGMHPISHGKNIVREVNLAQDSGTVFSIIDNRMGSYPSECVEKFIGLALRCCGDKPENRPSMLDVVRELERILQMIPDSVAESSDSKPTYDDNESLSSSYLNTSGDPCKSSNPFADDLVSGITLTVTPR